MASKVTFISVLCLLVVVCYQCHGQFTENNSFKSASAERAVVVQFGNVFSKPKPKNNVPNSNALESLGVGTSATKCKKEQFNLKIVRYFDFGTDTLTCTGQVSTPTCIGFCDNALSYYLIHPHDFSVKRNGKCCTADKFKLDNEEVLMSCTGNPQVPNLTFNWSGIVVDGCTSQ